MTCTKITLFSLARFFEESGSLKKIISLRKFLLVVDHMISFLSSIVVNCDDATVPKTYHHVIVDEIIQLFDGILQLGTAVAQWLRCYAINRKVAGSIPAGVIGIFY